MSKTVGSACSRSADSSYKEYRLVHHIFNSDGELGTTLCWASVDMPLHGEACKAIGLIERRAVRRLEALSTDLPVAKDMFKGSA